MGSRLEIGQLFDQLREEVRANAVVAGLALLILVIGNLALDYYLGESAALAPAGFLSLAMQVYVTRAALARLDMLANPSKAKLWSFWGMSIVTSIAIILGCLLLLIPGLYLAARWTIAGPAIFAEDLTAGAGMRRSWEATGNSTWHLAAALLLVYGAGLAPLMAIAIYFGEQVVPLYATAFIYACMFAGTVCAWLMAVSAYRLLADRQEGLAEVFA